MTPWGLRSLLAWVRDTYGGIDLYITEVTNSSTSSSSISISISSCTITVISDTSIYNLHHHLHHQNGVSDNLGNLDDLHRIYYYKHYINQV